MRQDQFLTSIYDFLGMNNSQNIESLLNQRKQQLGITSDRQLSNVLGINKDTLARIISGDSQKVDLISIIKISNFLNIDIDKTVKLYVSSLKPEAISEIEESRKTNYILENFDLDELKKANFIESKVDFKHIEERIVKYFGLNTIFEYSEILAYPLFSRSKISFSDKVKEFWIKSVYLQLETIDNPNDFVVENLRNIVTKLRPYTRLEKTGFLTVIKALYQNGITVIVQKYLSKTSVKGATFIVNNKPCIVLTDFQGRYDTLWFTLLHEICHVLYDLEDLAANKYHLTGEADLLLLNEDRANLFARELLFPKEKLDFVKYHIDSRSYVIKYAEQNNIHPSIIYGFHCYEKSLEGQDCYKFYRKYIISSDVAIKSLLTDYNGDNLFEKVKNLKELIKS